MANLSINKRDAKYFLIETYVSYVSIVSHSFILKSMGASCYCLFI